MVPPRKSVVWADRLLTPPVASSVPVLASSTLRSVVLLPTSSRPLLMIVGDPTAVTLPVVKS